MSTQKHISLRGRILLIVAVACFVCAGVAIGGFLHFNRLAVENGILNKEATIHAQLSGARDFVATQGGLDDIVHKYTAKHKSPEELTDENKLEILNQVPIYAALVIGKANAEKDNYEFRVFSDEPRRKENLATPHELEIFKKFENDPALKEFVFNDDKNITTYRPVRLSEKQGCMTCHGDPATSPWKNGTDILGHKMENWKDGKLHGVFAITQNVDTVIKASSQGQMIPPAGWLIGAIVLGALIALVFAAFMAQGPVRAINNVTADLSKVSASVSAVSTQVATSAQGLSQATTEQAASLEETAASLSEISAMITKAAESANSTATSSTESQEKADQGRNAVDQMLTSMEEISQSNEAIMNQVNHGNQQMSEIVKVIQEIGAKTTVINEIVFQTKLLSFNASVEAARAGEHGKGFAVVAEEVGNLAQMSGNASKEISDMLEASIAKVENIVKETQTSVATLIQTGKTKVESGISVARECSDLLNDIVSNVNKVSGLAQEISQASQEQSQGVNEINKAVAQLDTVTQQNATTSEQTARAATELSNQANSLVTAVDELVATVQGS